MLTPSDFYGYQREAIDHSLAHPDSMMWLGLGLGKTSVALTVAVERMKAGQVSKVLVFGPLRVVQSVWHAEARKWSHLKHLRFSLVHGDANARRRALFANAHVYLVNYENMSWLASELDRYFLGPGKPLPWQMVIYDEVTRCKNSTGVRINGGKRDIIDPRTGKETTVQRVAWRKHLDGFKYRMGLTGSPATNGYLDLHGQFLVVDGGKRLGPYKTAYKQNYFSQGYDGYSYSVTDAGKASIESRISDITLKMDTRDYRGDMPDAVETDVWVDLPPRARKVYKDMEDQMFAELDDGRNVEVFSGAASATKTLQIANGSAYVEQPPLDESDGTKVSNRDWSKIHDAKIKALQDVVEDANGRPVLVSYSFKTDAARIMQNFKGAVNMTAEPASKTEQIIQEWKDGKIKMLIGHPACLHPDTEVLTETRGWVPIVDVRETDRVFDGHEFVRHRGCQFSGIKPVVSVFGIKMTPDHKLLVNGEWRQANDIPDNQEARAQARFWRQTPGASVRAVRELRRDSASGQPERSKVQQGKPPALPGLPGRKQTSDVEVPPIPNLDGDEKPNHQGERQRLPPVRGQGPGHGPGVGSLRRFLGRNVRRLLRWGHHRPNQQRARLLAGQLPLGHESATAKEQVEQPVAGIQRQGLHHKAPERCLGHESLRPGTALGERNDSGSGGKGLPQPGAQAPDKIQGSSVDSAGFLRENRDQPMRSVNQDEERHERNRSRTRLLDVSPVYDIVDCGPRHQFLVRNHEGECFISHNSMGHGIDGLQDGGNIVVWFGLNWSLELYLQMNARIDRPGQTQPVSIVRILARDTIDEAVSDALRCKATDEASLKQAIAHYRHPEVSFL